MEDRSYVITLLPYAFLAALYPLISCSVQITARKNFLNPSDSAGITLESLESLTSQILSEYFADKSCFLVFADNSAAANHLLGSILGSNHHSIISIEEFDQDADEISFQKLLALSMEIGCPGHIIQTKNPQGLLSMIEKTYIKISQRIQRFFLVLPVSKDEETIVTFQSLVEEETDYLYEVFRSDSMRFIPDIVVIIPTYEKELALYTHSFGGPGDSFRDLVLLDVWSPETNGFRKNGENLLPDKIADLGGRIFTVSVLEYPPYVATGQETGELFGTEWNVVIEFCGRHNCTLKPLIDNVYLFGEIFDNGTGNGVLGNVVEDKADVGFGSLDLWYHEWLFLDLGPAFVRTAVTCLVPPPRPLPKWTTPIIPFDGILWCVVIVSIIIDSISIYGVYAIATCIRKTDDQDLITPTTSCMIAFGLSVEQGLNTEVRRVSQRVLIFSLLLVSLLISTSYGSGLSSVLTVPRFEKPIDTIRELEASGIKWSAPHEAWIFSLYGSNESWLLNLIDHFVVLQPDVTTGKAFEAEMGFCVERLPGGNYAIQDYLPAKAVENLHLMSGNIYWTYTVSMLRKSSPFTKRYTMLELELLASGIPMYWESVSVMLSLDTKTQYAVPDVVFGSQPVQLNIAQIQGAFLFLLLGLTAAVVIFTFEVSTKPRVN